MRISEVLVLMSLERERKRHRENSSKHIRAIKPPDK